MAEQFKILFRHDAFDGKDIESMWAVKVENGYKIDNIPFYVKSFSWGDIIDADEIEGQLYARNLVEESGHSTVRILFWDKSIINSTRETLKYLGCGSELSNIESLVSIDVPLSVNYFDLKEHLEDGEQSGSWEYEESCLSNKHKKDVGE